MNIDEIDIVKKFQHLVDQEDSIQADALTLLLKKLKIKRGLKVLDFGCGDGRHREAINKSGGKWFGVDLISSPELDSMKKVIGKSVVFDGQILPFKNQSFDLIFSLQVFEHVLNLKTVFGELARVLKIQGKFIGSTSHLEPYHSNSFRSITPYGLEKTMEIAGFKLERIKAGIDCFSLICARIFRNLLPNFLSNLINKIIWSPKGSLLNRIIHFYGRIKKIDKKTLECIKLQFSGHIIFKAKRI